MHPDPAVHVRAEHRQHPAPGAAQPQHSADGRWWWNGWQWVPAPYHRPPQPSRPAAPGPKPGRPSSGWIVLGVLLLLTSVCTTGVAAGSAGYLSADAVNRV